MKVRVISPVSWDGETHFAGEVVDMPEGYVPQLVADGVVVDVATEGKNDDAEEGLEVSVEVKALEDLTNKQLDVKLKELGLDPRDYSNKTKKAQAIVDNTPVEDETGEVEEETDEKSEESEKTEEESTEETDK